MAKPFGHLKIQINLVSPNNFVRSDKSEPNLSSNELYSEDGYRQRRTENRSQQNSAMTGRDCMRRSGNGRNASKFVYECQTQQSAVGENRQRSSNSNAYRSSNISIQRNGKALEILKSQSDSNINVQRSGRSSMNIQTDTNASSNCIKIEKKSDTANDKKGFTILTKASGNSNDVKTEQCPYCELVSLQYNELFEHILKRHKLFNLFVELKCTDNICQRCSIKFTDDSEMISHFVKVHEKDLLIFLRDNVPEQFDCKREKIKCFIEKHAPSLNTNYKRNYEISDSDYSDLSDEEDKKFDDSEYFAFISSSVNTNGISTQRKLDPSNFVVNANSENIQSNQSIESYLNELNEHEIYLKSKSLIYFDRDGCSCKICNKHFDTSIRLNQHCYEQHKIRITQELKRTLYFLTTNNLSQATDKELLQMPELRLELTLYPPIKQPENPRIPIMMNVPIIFSDFFLETLTVNLPESLKHVTPKVFNQPTVIMSKIPISIPILFKQSSQPNCTAFGFMNTPIGTAEEINTIIGSILDILSTKPIYCVSFQYLNSCPNASQFLDDICKKYGFNGLITPQLIDDITNTYSFKFYLIFTQNTNDDLDSIKKDIKMFMKSSEMAICKKCKELFNPQNSEELCNGLRSTIIKLELKKKSKHEFESIASSFEIEKVTLCDLL